jgi:hypothetical protein
LLPLASFNGHGLRVDSLPSANDGQGHRLAQGPFGKKAMKVVNTDHILPVYGHDEIAHSHAHLASWSIGSDRQNLYGARLGKMVEADQTTIELPLSGSDS